MVGSAKSLLLCMLLVSNAFSLSLAERYPNYRYIFSEFDVDDAYIYDTEFEVFALRYEKRMKVFYGHAIERGEIFLPMMQEQLVEAGLSDLFIYLSMVESGFSPAAVSPKKAVGLWQFMPATARAYSLSVCNNFDERRDPVNATAAAVAYLNKLHERFGKWYLAAMAYNCGEGCMQKAIKEAGSSELSVLLSERDNYLPQETRGYIRKILLAAMIGEKAILDFGAFNEKWFQVEVPGGTKLHTVAKRIEMNASKLMQMNTQFKNGIVPQERVRYKITLPEEKMIAFYLRYPLLQNAPEIKKGAEYYLLSHRVKLGESLEGIAKKYQSTSEEIKRVNRMKDAFLTLGALLVVPVTKVCFEAQTDKQLNCSLYNDSKQR